VRKTAAMTYRGEVTPGGRTAVRELTDVFVRKASVSAMNNNCYLLSCRATGEQLLIDAADDASRLLRLVQEGAASVPPHAGPDLGQVVTTHQHWDHHRALADVVAATGARALVGREDADGLPDVQLDLLDHGDVVTFGKGTLEAVPLRGHTPGSIALLLRSGDRSLHLFSGDSLFPGGPGRTRTPEQFATLMDDLEERVFAVLPDSTWVYPGHGDDTTLGAERPYLQEWRARGW
jgi:glyoxylase-like metal-dependent hydrolase (beta-lactamase superfamily II)